MKNIDLKKNARKKIQNKEYLTDTVKDLKINTENTKKVIEMMESSGGFESKNFAAGVKILNEMKDDGKCTRILSVVGALLSTGIRGIIKDMIKEKMFDCIITTCGALDHDIARTFEKYYSGDFQMDDYKLKNKKIHRLGNILIPMENYGPLIENSIQKILNEFYKSGKRDVGSFEIIDFIGSKLNESSFLYWANKNNIPVIVPGIVDGAVGSQFWLFNQNHSDFRLNILKDQTKMSDIIFDAKKTGALMLGGGISKHHTLWWNQFRGGLDYAVYLTTANEWDGSLSGALVREAVSWNKINPTAKHVTIHGEITTLLPFMFSAIR